MRHRKLLVSMFVLLCFAILPGTLFAQNFNFSCPSNRYVSKPLGEQWQFLAPISAIAPDNDSVDVIFEAHVPDGWGAQWCQHSTGICFPESQRIRLVVGVLDRLEIDFYPTATAPAMGWVDITIRSVADPLDVSRCAFTLYSGMPVPDPSFTVDCTDNVRRMTTGDGADFFSPMENLGADMDTLIVRMFSSATNGMWAQFCQVSTGICFQDVGWLAMVPNVADQLHLQVFVPEIPSSGAFDLVFQSKLNPSIAKYCYYRVFAGNFPAGAPVATNDVSRGWVTPNPSSGLTTIALHAASASAGRLTIFGADGRIVRSFPGVDLRNGSSSVRWDGSDNQGTTVAPGIYFYRFQAGETSLRGTIVRVR